MKNRNKKKKHIIIALIIILSISTGIGYSVLSQDLEIGGIVNIEPPKYLAYADQADSETGPVFKNSNIAKSQIEAVYTLAENIVPDNAIESWDASAQNNKSITAYTLDKDENGLYELYLTQDGGVNANPDSLRLFNYFINAHTIDLSNFNTSDVTDMRAMFQKCINLTTLILGNFDTGKVVNMGHMFNYASKLENIDLSSFDTSNVTSMYAMFGHTFDLKSIDLSNFDTSKVLDMSYMFYQAQKLKEIDLSSFNTTNVTSMSFMFCNTIELTEIKFGENFKTSNVENMREIFGATYSLKSLDLSGWDISKVTDMTRAFQQFSKKNTNATIKLNKTPFNSSVVLTNIFNDTAATNITITLYSAADKTLIDGLGYENVRTVVG